MASDGKNDVTLEERLDLAESEAEIAWLVHGYARSMRNGRPQDAVRLFTADGTFEICQGMPGKGFSVGTRLETPEALLAHLTAGDVSPPVCPMIHNLMIDIDGETARANSVMETPVLGTDHRILGEYHDSFRRENGQWLFSARQYVVFREG
jgi:hypothetical protein